MTLGDRIVYHRQRNGLSQKGLAELLGVTPTRLNYWEKDKREPDLQMFNALCAALGIDGDELLGRDRVGFEFDQTDIDFLKKYRELDDLGKKHVQTVVDWEISRRKELDKLGRLSKKAPPDRAPEVPEKKTKFIKLIRDVAAGPGVLADIDLEDYEVPEDSYAEYAIKVNGYSPATGTMRRNPIIIKRFSDFFFITGKSLVFRENVARSAFEKL